MADNRSLCLIGAMDRLWFHQIILFPEPISLFSLKPLKPQQPYSESIATPTSPSATSLAEENISTPVCPLFDHQPLAPAVIINLRSSTMFKYSISQSFDDSKNEEEEEEMKKRERRGSFSSRSRSHSSSPSTEKRLRNHRHSTSRSLGGKLKKSTSCKSLEDLELEEVKGFMDLGFIFKKEHLDSRMIDVVPGLLRLGFLKTQPNLPADEHEVSKDDDDDDDDDDDIEQEDQGSGVIRPYLSEAWLIKRPDSPLLNLKVPRVSAAADMKKHLKCWARTVASVVQQEC
ncbi:Mlo-related protein [Gossypium australe]|uniref:Mlo-related protein n=1 Tax=Gossypium australe TaxID=47621 RepID=A0A5B6UN82_9ROSI|nr:Mlo-related protein [Gossypium australe]